MSNLISVPAGFSGAALPSAFQGLGGASELSEGVTGGFGIVTYKGKVWRTKYRGEEKVLLAADGRNPRPELEVVIIKAAPHISKVFYETGFVDGSNAPPDCWSVNGIVPDGAASKKQSNTCAGCKQNAWGSRVSEMGKAGKACSDNKRLVIVPAADILNESMGGPMMLRVPPASLQDMAAFGKFMDSQGFPYYSFVTRLRFNPDEAYPRFIFEAVRPLTEDEARMVIQLRNDPVTQRILEAPVTEVQHDTDASAPSQPPPASALFTPAAAAQAAQMAAQVTGQPQPVPAQQPVQQTAPPPTPPVAQTQPSASTVAAQPQRPRFDPMTGQPIIYPDEQPQQAQPTSQVFPEMPQELVRAAPQVAQKPQPVVAQPVSAEPVKIEGMGDFDAALDNLLGGVKK